MLEVGNTDATVLNMWGSSIKGVAKEIVGDSKGNGFPSKWLINNGLSKIYKLVKKETNKRNSLSPNFRHTIIYIKV